jgi:protease-4
MRKHPILFGLLIIVIFGAFSYFYFYRLGLSAHRTSPFSLKNKVGVVTVEGVISDSEDVLDAIEEFGEDDSIAAVVLRINSPGGGVAAAQEIYAAVKELRKKKKVVTSMASVAASGGLLIACAADKIVANPGTLTGSISAIMHFANLEDLMKKLGIKASVVKSGQYKDIGSPLREMTKEEKQIIQDLVDDIYEQFIEVIMKDRNLPREKVLEIADGRVFSGRKAKELGLVDELGDMASAAKLALKLSGKDGRYELVYPKKKKSSMLDFFIKSSASLLASSLKQEMGKVQGLDYLYYPLK